MNDSSSRFGSVARVALWAALALPVQGCTLAAYGIGVATMVNDSATRQSEAYAAYVKRAEEENVERAKAGLPAGQVLSRRAWARQSSQP